MLTRFILSRPRLALVISLLITLAGLLSLPRLPLTEYPDVTPPAVEVKAFYPGASAGVIERTVAAPLEEEINGVNNMLYMTSTSASDGSFALKVYFQVGMDPDRAQHLVESRIERAKFRLPKEILTSGISVRKSLSSQLAFVTFYSPQGSWDTTFIANYVKLNILDELRRLPEIGDAYSLGRKDYSIRIWLDPVKMANFDITVGDIQKAVAGQNAELAAGHLGQRPSPGHQQHEYVIETDGRLESPEQFEQIILRATPDGRLLRLRDVARIELAAETYSAIEQVDGRESSNLMIYLEPGANAIEASASMNRVLGRLARDFPKDFTYLVPYDISSFVKESLHELAVTLLLTITLVISVIVAFLKDWRASLIPAVTIPISLIGTFVILLLLGYSLNIITLFGLILAVGLVVDDAIVVTENVQRHLQQGFPPKQAVISAMKEVTGPIIATTLVLLAVFIPAGFISGTTGHFYQQFAVATSGAVIISSVCALTLSPVMCVMLMKPISADSKQQREGVFKKVSLLYLQLLDWLERRPALIVATFCTLLFLCIWWMSALPKAFVPNEDRGFFYMLVTLPDNTSLSKTQTVTDEINSALLQVPGVAHTVSVSGLDVATLTSTSNSAMIVALLAPWQERSSEHLDVNTIIGQAMAAAGHRHDSTIIPVPPSSLPALSYLGGFEFRLLNPGQTSHADMGEQLGELLRQANASPEIGLAFSSFNSSQPHTRLTIDNDKALALGVDIGELYTRLQAHFGSLTIGSFQRYGRSFPIIIQGDSDFRQDTSVLNQLYVRNNKGQQLPLSVFVHEDSQLSPPVIEHFNMYRTATVNGQRSETSSLKQAMNVMARLGEQLPPGYSFDWSGVSREEARSGNQLFLVILLAVIFAWMFLVVQYESLMLPLAVLASVPIGIVGALASLWLTGSDNTIYAQISMILLIGLSAKNAILIVEFADVLRSRGMSTLEAAREAGRLRLRAILMTALSFLLGVLPLLSASGAGANGRFSLGLTLLGGMISIALLSTLLTPGFYQVVQTVREKFSRK